MLGRIVDLVRRLDSPEVAIGVGVPGRVDVGERAVLSGGIVDLASVALADRIEAARSKPVVIDNDASMALIAEMPAVPVRGIDNAVMFTIGTGIGGAVMERGGSFGAVRPPAARPHRRDVHGRACVCGPVRLRRNHQLGHRARPAHRRGGPRSRNRYRHSACPDAGGHAASGRVLEDWARPLRAAIDSAVAMFDPDIVLLGGGLGRAAHRALADVPSAALWHDCPVKPARLGDDAGVIGAGLSALANGGPAARTDRAKRAVLVNGVPASGKSAVSRLIADATGWPLFALDSVKNPFLDHLGGGDRDFNRTLGRASYQAIWSVVRDAPAGTTVIVDAWFGFQPRDVLGGSRGGSGGRRIPPKSGATPLLRTLAERYARLDERHVGHPGAGYIPELIALAERAQPLERGRSSTSTRPSRSTSMPSRHGCNGHGQRCIGDFMRAAAVPCVRSARRIRHAAVPPLPLPLVCASGSRP